MFHSRWLDLAAVIGFFYLVGPVIIRSTFRFNARCKPLLVPLEQLPPTLAELFRKRIPQLQNLGFELIGCYDCGALAANTRSYVAYLCNHTNKDFANVSAVVAGHKTTGYFEFSTRFVNGTFLETNSNRVLPLTPPNPDVRVFRFSWADDPAILYGIHRRLLDRYAAGLWAQGEPAGQEIHRLVRVVEGYGPRHARIGYMYLPGGQEAYRLTWKGAFFMTWRALWPVSWIRKVIERLAMQSELRALETLRATAWQKA